jgi:hypothetical protein
MRPETEVGRAQVERDPCSASALAAHPPLDGRSDAAPVSGVGGFHCGAGAGVSGGSAGGVGVQGLGETAGVVGECEAGRGVEGRSRSGVGVFGSSRTSEGVHGETRSTFFAAVAGLSTNPAPDPSGGASAGVFGRSEAGEGVHGESRSPTHAAIAGVQLNPESQGAAIFGEHRGDGPAGFFNGNVVVTKDIVLLNADCAEDFDLACEEAVEPGTVMVIDDGGALGPCRNGYDRRVAGVVSGAGDLRPAIILGKRAAEPRRVPVALVGKVWCKADARHAPIRVGDLLTTSPTPGHAMKAEDPLRAFGAVLGKAMGGLEGGMGLVPVLVALQ